MPSGSTSTRRTTSEAESFVSSSVGGGGGGGCVLPQKMQFCESYARNRLSQVPAGAVAAYFAAPFLYACDGTNVTGQAGRRQDKLQAV